MNEGKIIIPIGRSKVIVLVLASAGFVAIGIWMWTISGNQGLFSPEIRKITSIVTIAFFGLCGIYGSLKIFDRKPGLIIDEEGIVDNSSGVAVGRIKWDEIRGIRENQIFGQRFVTIEVTDPESILNRVGAFKAKMNSANFRLTCSPVNISANTLTLGFDQLWETLNQALDAHKKCPAKRAS